MTRCLCTLLLLMLTWHAGMACAEPLPLTAIPEGSLGRHATLLIEDGAPLTLAAAVEMQRAGRFRRSENPVLSFGMGARPLWVHLDLNNPGAERLPLRLLLGTAWLDRLDVFLVQDGRTLAVWHTGDTIAHPPELTPALGYTFATVFPPGRSALFVRVETIDPMVLPIALRSEPAYAAAAQRMRYSYGFVYGYLLALFAFYALLFVGLRETSHFYYALYLAVMVLLNIAYTGHGYVWLWPGEPGLQRYLILLLMVLFCCIGLTFASRFLTLAQHAPRALSVARWFAGGSVLAIALCVAADSQLGAVLVAFHVTALFTVLMVVLGLLAVSHGHTAGRYYLAAVVCGMVGALTTTLAVWGWLPFGAVTFRAAEAGIMAEATLLALALAHQLRHQQQETARARMQARIDPLTGLQNRRGFYEQAAPVWGTAQRRERPLALIQIDIDHFKRLNDEHGHDAGDRALVDISRLLAASCRAGDILARWGGEEFILLLPESSLHEAQRYAERLRQLIEVMRHAADGLPVTASFGVVERTAQTSLDELIKDADVALYAAKQAGRNRVSPAMTQEVAPGPAAA